jgi:hypothetical protein
MVEPMTYEEYCEFVQMDWEFMLALADGREWSYPTGESYRIDHKYRVLVHLGGPVTELHAALLWCAGRMGYHIIKLENYENLKKDCPL